MTPLEQHMSACESLERHASMMRHLLSGPHSASASNARRFTQYFNSAKYCVSQLQSIESKQDYMKRLHVTLNDASTDPHFYRFGVTQSTLILEGAFDIEKIRRTIAILPLRAV